MCVMGTRQRRIFLRTLGRTSHRTLAKHRRHNAARHIIFYPRPLSGNAHYQGSGHRFQHPSTCFQYFWVHRWTSFCLIILKVVNCRNFRQHCASLSGVVYQLLHYCSLRPGAQHKRGFRGRVVILAYVFSGLVTSTRGGQGGGRLCGCPRHTVSVLRSQRGRSGHKQRGCTRCCRGRRGTHSTTQIGATLLSSVFGHRKRTIFVTGGHFVLNPIVRGRAIGVFRS